MRCSGYSRPPKPMSEVFQLEIIQHPETQLYHTWQPAPQQVLQLLLLFDNLYLAHRQQGEWTSVLPVKDPALIQKVAQQNKLDAEDQQRLENLLPIEKEEAAKPEQTSLQTSSGPLSNSHHALSAYQPQRTTGTGHQPSPTAPHAVLRSIEETPLITQTTPLIEATLEIAQEQQQALLTQAEHLQQDIQKQQLHLQQQLRQMPQLEQELELLNQKLEEWQLAMEAEHHHQDHLIHHTQQELIGIQEHLQGILSSGMALQNHLRSRRLPEDHQLQHKLSYLEEMVDHVLAQRHSVHYILQQKSYQHLEEQRLDVLKQRYKNVSEAREKLAEHVQQLETVNREILLQDPLAVPEPVPIMALHELQRLQFEQDILEADPGLQAYLKSIQEHL